MVAAAVLVFLDGGAKPPLATAAGSCSGGDASLDAEEQGLIALTNSYRAEHGLGTLSAAPGLNRTAAWMAMDMLTKAGFSHTDSLGRPFYTRANDCGYDSPGGENIGAGTNRNTAASAFELFRNSPAHNEIMLSPEFGEIGVARASGGPYGWYWAVEFGHGSAPAPAPPPAATAVPAPVAPPPPPAPASEPAPAVSADLPAGITLVTWKGDDTPVATALDDIRGTVRSVYAYDPWFDAWLLYSPNAPQYLQTLPTFVNGQQYWVITDAPAELLFAQ